MFERNRAPFRVTPEAARRHLLLTAVVAAIAAAGTLVSPGDLYGAAGSQHARVALVQPLDRLQLALDRLDAKEDT